MERTILLIDDEENIVHALKRLLRRDGYRILTGNSGQEGLDILAEEQVGVVVSDQRMPGMNGTEFLRRVKEQQPDSVRIVLSGYTDLKSIADAINEGAIYKFLTKPWEDELLRANIIEAFNLYELKQDNKRLTEELQVVNEDLRKANLELEKHIQRQNRSLDVNLHALQVSQDVLENLPLGILGVGPDGMIALANHKAHGLLARGPGSLVGALLQSVLPNSCQSFCQSLIQNQEPSITHLVLDNQHIDLQAARLGQTSSAQGWIVILLPQQELCHA